MAMDHDPLTHSFIMCPHHPRLCGPQNSLSCDCASSVTEVEKSKTLPWTAIFLHSCASIQELIISNLHSDQYLHRQHLLRPVHAQKACLCCRLLMSRPLSCHTSLLINAGGRGKDQSLQLKQQQATTDGAGNRCMISQLDPQPLPMVIYDKQMILFIALHCTRPEKIIP